VTARPQARRRLAGIFAGVVVVGLVLAVGLFAPRKSDPTGAALGASAAAPSVPSTLDASTAPQPDSVATVDSPLAASSQAATTAPAPSALPTSLAARPSAVAGSKPRPTTSPAVPMPPPKVSCTPPFVVDANGERKYKPECL
jgi:serine/threonine-protein kinase